MQIRIRAQHFKKVEQALEEIRAMGLQPWGKCFSATHNEPHWHDFSAFYYITAGELFITDIARDITFRVRTGARVEIPARVVHREHSPVGYNIVGGLTVDPKTLPNPMELEPKLLQAPNPKE